MKKILLILIGFLSVIQGYTQPPPTGDSYTLDLGAIEISPEKQKKLDAAFGMADVVQKTGSYIKSLSELINNNRIPLPVGIKGEEGGYELIVHKVYPDPRTHKTHIYTTCAFKFKDTGQPIAFEGEAVLGSETGLGTAGHLSLITPVRRNIGKESALIIHEGTAVNFGCEGIESFDAVISWITTSSNIIAVNRNGIPTNRPLQTTFKTRFRHFDDYSVSLNIDQSFCIRGLNDMIFTLKGATLDQSDTETSPLVKFPPNYFFQSNKETLALWKGLYISEATVSLPQIFKKQETGGSERLTVSLQNTLFDENGFTGNVAVNDLLPSETIRPENWDISLTDFSLGVLKSKIIAFGFGGDLNIPPFGKNSLHPYTASINPVTGEYEFKAGIAGKYDFPVLHSSITLNELSNIDILLRENEIYPSIHASGMLTVNAPLGSDTTKTLSIPGVTFENMVISRESPHLKIGAIGVTGELHSPNLAGLELSITGIQPFTDAKGSGLAFNTGITLNEMFGGFTRLKLYGDYAHWKFREVEVERVKVDYHSPAFALSGEVWFKNGDKVYGDGFRGDIRLTLVDKFTFDAVGIFGRKDDYRYFLADAFYEKAPPAGIPVPPVLNFYGFGGGLYRKMQQSGKMSQQVTGSGLEFGKSLSGISYLPDKKVGLGVMATTKFSFSSSAELFNAKVGFEMQFNDRGGLNFVQLRGDAAFVDKADKWGKLSDNIMSRMDKLEKAGIPQPEKAKKSDLEKASENKSNGFLTASLNIEYDVINKTFSADLNSYLNAGVIRGVGANDRLGWASAYFSPGRWYTYLGTPSDRLGVKVLNLAELNGYFMLGDNIPALPAPPQKVLKNLSADKQAKLLTRKNSNKLSMGTGMAFGAAFDMKFNARLTPFYAKFGVGLGAEFMLTDLRGSLCQGYSGTPGLNGWYAQGQAWAYVEADIGVEAKIFGRRRSFSILDLSVGALLEGAGPNPLYFSGSVGGRFRVLGGLVKGNCTFDFEIGEKCVLIRQGSPFGEDVISQLSPGEGDRDINVFAAPQAILNIPVGQEMIINEDDVRGTYMATLEEFTIKYRDTGKTATGKNRVSSDGTVIMFTPDEPFESQKDVEIYARVAFKKKEKNNWVYVTGDNGKAVIEDKKAVFRTGERPKEILPEHVVCSYPVDRQYNYYPKEYNKGYILLSQNYSYLFSTEKPEGFDQKIRVADESGKTYENPFTYKTGSSIAGVKMEIDFSTERVAFEKDRIYKLAIVNIPQNKQDIKSNITSVTTAVEGQEDMQITRQQVTGVLSQQSEKEIYALHFHSSRYDSFYQKVKAFDKKSEGWRDYAEPFVHYIKTNLRDPELFDTYEIQGVNNQKLVRFTALVEQTDWYNQTFYKDMYQSQTSLTPPVQKVEIMMGVPDKELTDDEININMASGYNTQGTFHYAVPYWCARDFQAVKQDIARRVIKGQANGEEVNLLARDFPPVVFKGDYPVDVSYVLPGREITTSTVSMTMYNPVEP